MRISSWSRYHGSEFEIKNASVDPDSHTDITANWTIGQLSAGYSWNVTFNATIVAYGTDDNTASTSGTVDKIGGVIVQDEDSVRVTTMPPARIDVEKKVWNAGEWEDVIPDAKIGDVYRFNCTIHNNGNFPLTDIRLWDILNFSLEYAGNATLVTPDGVKRNISLPTTLYMHSLSVEPADRLGIHTMVYPEQCKILHLKKWVDNKDRKLSPSDQILLEEKISGKQSWYHVDEVTVTLELSDKNTGKCSSSLRVATNRWTMSCTSQCPRSGTRSSHISQISVWNYNR